MTFFEEKRLKYNRSDITIVRKDTLELIDIA